MRVALVHISYLLLSLGLSYAAPVTSDETFGRSSNISDGSVTLNRRSGTPVCGIDSRLNVRELCKENNLQYTWDKDKNVLTAVTRTGEPADSTAECDHALELQVLARTFEANGVCTALDAISNAAGLPRLSKVTDFKASMLDLLFKAINAKTNTIFLPKVINGKKKDLVHDFLWGNPHPAASPEVNAVRTYYQNPLIRTNTMNLAAQLDTLAHQMITQRAPQSPVVAAALAGMKTSTTTRRPTSERAAAQNAISNAVTAWQNANAANAVTIAGRWGQFLNWVLTT